MLGSCIHRSATFLVKHTDRMAKLSQFSIVTYERRPGQWRAAITPYAISRAFIRGKTTTSFVTPEDSASEPDARFAAEKIIGKL